MNAHFVSLLWFNYLSQGKTPSSTKQQHAKKKKAQKHTHTKETSSDPVLGNCSFEMNKVALT
jgi:hypothetical protein